MFVKLAVYVLRSNRMELEDVYHFTSVDQRISTHVQSSHNLCIIWDINGLMVGIQSHRVTSIHKLFHLPLHVSVYLLNPIIKHTQQKGKV